MWFLWKILNIIIKSLPKTEQGYMGNMYFVYTLKAQTATSNWLLGVVAAWTQSC